MSRSWLFPVAMVVEVTARAVAAAGLLISKPA
jgi:hypothetical protein